MPADVPEMGSQIICITDGDQAKADATAQALERKAHVADDSRPGPPPPHSVSRSASMAVWGFTMSGFVVAQWFKRLNAWFPPSGMTLPRLLKKIAVNQAVISPTFNGLFFGYAIFTRSAGKSFGELWEMYAAKVRQDLGPTIRRSMVYWSSVLLVNFTVVPVKFNVLFTNLCFFTWTICESGVGDRDRDRDRE